MEDEETCIIQMFENRKKVIAILIDFILNHRMAFDTDYMGLAQNDCLPLFHLSGMCIILKLTRHKKIFLKNTFCFYNES